MQAIPGAGCSSTHPPLARCRQRHVAAASTMDRLEVAGQPAQLRSLRDLPQRYSAVLLDQFGVLHDGVRPYAGAIAAVEHLYAAGMKLLIISNSSRRSKGALGNLERMGFPSAAFCGVITSGEVVHSLLEQRPTPFWQARRRCLHFTWGDRGAISLEGLGLEVTTDPAQADCIVAHGTECVGTSADGQAALPCSLEHMRALMAGCSGPMIVANPDVVTVSGSELRVMPGTLARWYSELGGEVHLMGKPAGVIYERALGMLGLPAERVVAIGDSMEHDIAGAAAAGVDAVFVGGGIHAAELGVGPPGAASQEAGIAPDALQRLCQQSGARPAYALPYFAL